jgi:hypothetical protein
MKRKAVWEEQKTQPKLNSKKSNAIINLRGHSDLRFDSVGMDEVIESILLVIAYPVWSLRSKRKKLINNFYSVSSCSTGLLADSISFILAAG